ncbi:RNA dependent RNA polymerase-domain-containing protein [Sporodiniella umbellata]|nr:RNA dependent RNA polymerase-domain-containing protein [Sporodiniella umbellata]
MNHLPFSFLRATDKCIVAYNLCPQTTEGDLWDLFEKEGKVKHIQIRKGQNVAAAIVFSTTTAVDNILSKKLALRNEIVQAKELDLSDYVERTFPPFMGEKLYMGGLSTPTTFVNEWSSTRNIRLDINTFEKYVEIFFFHMNSPYRLRIKYRTTLKNTILQRNKQQSVVIVAAKYPAYFWRMSAPQSPREAYDFSCWERVTEIPMDRKKNMLRLDKWSVYKVEMDIDDQTHDALACRIFEATQTSQGLLETQTIKTDQEYVPRLENELRWKEFPFEVYYMLQHAFYLKILREYNIGDDFYQTIGTLEPHIACRLLSLICIGQNRLYSPNKTIYNIFKNNSSLHDPPEPVPEGYTLSRKLLITPTSMYPLHPVLQKMNHLQFQHKKYGDRFLLVEFSDEELMPIAPCPFVGQNDRLYKRIYKVLKKGIMLAGRQYDFLCSSIEDLKLHRCWFFAPIKGFSREDILYWIGDLSEITSVPQYMASVGQALSSRLTSLDIQTSEVEEIDSFEKNGVIFARECGKMSPNIAREISRVLELSYTPNVVQFNLAGARGILMLSNYLQKRKIQLRSSQIHFDSHRLTLEVIKVSRQKRAYIDKHTIPLLHGLGIPLLEFHQRAENFLSDYLTGSPQKNNFLNRLMEDYYADMIDSHHYRLFFSGFLERSDPLITNLVLAFQNHILRELIEDNKIYVENGARAYAIVDETGTLEYDEVFFQSSTSKGKNTKSKVIEGECVIFRDNTYSPKNVIVARAVDRVALRGYNNVLIYPAGGFKDFTSYCSNDGPEKDDFTIIWDKALVPKRSNCSPKDAIETVNPNSIQHISFQDMAKFVVNYISEDFTSLAKDAWCAAVDRHKTSVFHGKASYLETKITIATGISDSITTDPMLIDVYEYPVPDFMTDNPTISYMSKKPVGYIYRDGCGIEERPYLLNRCEYDPRMYVEGMHQYVLEARKSRIKYDNSLRLLMGEYGVRSEIEFVSGIIVNWPKYVTENSKKELSRRIRDVYLQFKRKWRRAFEEDFEKHTKDLPEEKLDLLIEAKAAAWYYVTYHPCENKTLSKKIEVYTRQLSFPWVVGDCLMHIATKNTNRTVLTIHRKQLPESLVSPGERQITALVMSDSESEEEYESKEDDTSLRKKMDKLYL